MKRLVDLEPKVIELHESGLSDVQIAKIIGHNSSYVRLVRVRYGYDRKNPTQTQLKIKELYQNGMKPAEIARDMGKSCKNINHTLQGLGLLEKQVPSERQCAYCGKTFVGRDNRAKFCCEKCQRESNHKIHDAERRSRLKSSIIDTDINLQKLIERDKSICYLCGKPIDLNDYKIVNGRKKPLKMYPTIDHVIPLIKGGSHSWDNVKLAHLHCNASKGANE